MEQPVAVRALGVSGSPRRNGNTETLVDEVLRGASEAGALVDKVILNELHITPCQGCDACESTGECLYEDDMPAVLDKMAQSQIWVLGTPVYWWGPSAQLKLFLDRWYSRIFRPEDKTMFKGRQVILAIPMGDDDPRTARHTIGMFVDALAYVGADLAATVLAPGVNNKGEVSRCWDVLADARRAGHEAVSRLHSSGKLAR